MVFQTPSSFRQVREQGIPIFNADRAFSYLQKQCDFGPRNPGSAAHGKTREYLRNELEGLADEVVEQSFTAYNITMTNILARFARNGSPILLCAHWDT